jgi:sodium/potassium-transporting ATPase subunit alpha
MVRANGAAASQSIINRLMSSVLPCKKQEHKSNKIELKDVESTYHKMTLDELNSEFNTSCTHGLTTSKAKELLITNGPNLLKPPETHHIRKILGYLFGGFCWIFWIGALGCFLAYKPLGEPSDPTNLALGFLYLIVIFLNAFFEAFQDWSSSQVMKSIKGMMASDSTLIRDGQECKVPAAELVVGDLVVLSYGQKVPADLRLIESSDLKFDRAMLTGESEAVDGMYILFFNYYFNEERDSPF